MVRRKSSPALFLTPSRCTYVFAWKKGKPVKLMLRHVFACFLITNFFHTENCIYPLGLESGDITDEALTHSVNTILTVSDPSDIRLNKNPGGFPNGWQAARKTLDYIQVEKSWVKLATLFCLWLFQPAYFVFRGRVPWNDIQVQKEIKNFVGLVYVLHRTWN